MDEFNHYFSFYSRIGGALIKESPRSIVCIFFGMGRWGQTESADENRWRVENERVLQ